jgi:hypothetical protein
MVLKQPRRHEQPLEELKGITEAILRNSRFQPNFC